MSWPRIHRNLKIIGAITTVFFGVWLVIAPNSVSDFTGLAIDNPRGMTEIRAAMGGLFTAIGIAPLAFRKDAMYRMLGLGYVGIAVVRLAAMFIDGSAGAASNWQSLAYEVVFGVLLFLPLRAEKEE